MNYTDQPPALWRPSSAAHCPSHGSEWLLFYAECPENKQHRLLKAISIWIIYMSLAKDTEHYP